MAEFVGVKVEGAARLRKTMSAAGADMKNMNRLNKEAAEIVVPVAKALAPIGTPEHGHIASTIRAGATRKAGIVRAGGKRLPYAGLIHYGTERGHTDVKGRTRAIQAQPFIAQAAKQTEPIWVQNYFDGLMQVLDSIKGE